MGGIMFQSRLLSAVSLIVLPVVAFAAKVVTPAAYDCRLAIIANDIPNSVAEFNYRAEASGQAHGGKTYSFSSQGHKVAVLSDSRWLGVTWERNGKTIASTVTARAEDNQSSQALIVYNPSDENEQVALSCTARGQE